MSTYNTLQGKLTAPDQATLEKGLQISRDGQWMKDNDFLCDGQKVSRNCVKGLTIKLSYGLYRNIDSLLEALKKLGFKVEQIGYCTDGCFEGFKDDKTVDLRKYAKKHNLGEQPNIEKNPNGYCSWMDKVGDHFMEHEG